MKGCSELPEEDQRGPAGCRVGVRPAGGRSAMQGVGGDSSVSHCTQGVTSAGWEGTKKGRDREEESGQRDKKVRDLSQAVRVFLHLSLSGMERTF